MTEEIIVFILCFIHLNLKFIVGISGVNDVIIVLDTSKDQLDEKDIPQVTQFIRAFLKSYSFRNSTTRVSIILDAGNDNTKVLLQLKDGGNMAVIDYILSQNGGFTYGGQGGPYQSTIRSIRNSIAQSTNPKTILIFSKTTSSLMDAIQKDDDIKNKKNTIVVPVAIGDRDGSEDTNVVTIDLSKNLPSVYPTLELVIKEALGKIFSVE